MLKPSLYKNFALDFSLTIFQVRLLSGGNFEDVTERVEVANHAAVWNQSFTFLCRIGCDPETGVLEKCECRISLRKVSFFPMI